MKRVQPFHRNDTGAKVLKLHQCLLFLILNQRDISDNDRDTLAKRLAPEMRDETFGQTTHDLVYIWQDQMKERADVPKEIKSGFVKNGDVDAGTAKALNWLLAQLGALRVSRAQPAAPQDYQGIPKALSARLRAPRE